MRARSEMGVGIDHDYSRRRVDELQELCACRRGGSGRAFGGYKDSHWPDELGHFP